MDTENPKKLRVKTVGREYDIVMGKGIRADSARLIRSVWQGKKLLLLTDSRVNEIYGQSMVQLLQDCAEEIHVFVFEEGEKSKSIATLSAVYEFLAEKQFTRSDLIVALGGGVCGDLAGFAAATYMRGIRFVQIPTTLLAQVDSSVGGKTAINLAHGKNLAGAFWQPSLVISDIDFLDTLDKREFDSGMAEVIKTAAIQSESLFSYLEEEQSPDLIRVIYECCCIKAKVVAEDEFDKGLRMILNFGHTIGHAIEKQGQYSRYTHGEAVAAGMLIAANLGVLWGITPKEDAVRLRNVVKRRCLNLPDSVDCAALTEMIKLDKKADSDKIHLILLRKLGEADIFPVRVEKLFAALTEEGGISL